MPGTTVGSLVCPVCNKDCLKSGLTRDVSSCFRGHLEESHGLVLTQAEGEALAAKKSRMGEDVLQCPLCGHSIEGTTGEEMSESLREHFMTTHKDEPIARDMASRVRSKLE